MMKILREQFCAHGSICECARGYVPLSRTLLQLVKVAVNARAEGTALFFRTPLTEREQNSAPDTGRKRPPASFQNTLPRVMTVARKIFVSTVTRKNHFDSLARQLRDRVSGNRGLIRKWFVIIT